MQHNLEGVGAKKAQSGLGDAKFGEWLDCLWWLNVPFTFHQEEVVVTSVLALQPI